jgi:hypothetical protein
MMLETTFPVNTGNSLDSREIYCKSSFDVFLIRVAACIYRAPRRAGGILSRLVSAICRAAGQVCFPIWPQRTGYYDDFSSAASALRLNDLVAYRITHQLTHVVQVQLAHYIGSMRLDCLYAKT